MTHRTYALTAATLLFSGLADAHTFGAQGAVFAEGLAHPLIGVDHLLVMIGVGLWAVQAGGRAVWLIPAIFMAMMAAGAGLAHLGLNLPYVETAIVLSVVGLGLMVATSANLSRGPGVLLVALFALFHGHAHGLEMPEAGAPLAYAAGFLLATLSLHLVGLGLGYAGRGLTMALRLGGVAMAATGVYWLTSLQA